MPPSREELLRNFYQSAEALFDTNIAPPAAGLDGDRTQEILDSIAACSAKVDASKTRMPERIDVFEQRIAQISLDQGRLGTRVTVVSGIRIQTA